MRLRQRGLTAVTLLQAVATLEIIETYPEDKYLPSFLLRGESKGSTFHAHIAIERDRSNIRVVTIYWPSFDKWDVEARVRRIRL